MLDDGAFLKQLIQSELQEILSSQFSEFIQAQPYERSSRRQGHRNGSSERTLKTRVGSVVLRVPRDRDGRFSSELFERYQRSEKAFFLALAEMYIQGVSTRRVSEVVESLCGDQVSKSMVSRLTMQLDEQIESWPKRRLSESYPYLIIDARYESIRKAGRIISQAVFIIVGINQTGKREILAVEAGNSESEEHWREVFKGLKDRGLSGVSYLVSDDHKGLVSAVRREFQGIGWQRCQVHFIRNFIRKFKGRSWQEYINLLQDVFNAPAVDQARERKTGLVENLLQSKPEIANWLDEEIEECFTVYTLPAEHRKRMHSTNMLERFNQELKRRSRVVRIFPNRESCLGLFGAMCMDQSEQWQTGPVYLDMTVKSEREKGATESAGDGVTFIPLRSISVTPL